MVTSQENTYKYTTLARCIINEIGAISKAALPLQHPNRPSLITAVSKYKVAMELLTVHHELVDEETNQFQDLCDDFFTMWIEIFGDKGVTNYIHMLGSSLILYFIKKYGRLYLYSQQGWKSLNSTNQTLILQDLQRGVLKMVENPISSLWCKC
jgi:hypothetical protein